VDNHTALQAANLALTGRSVKPHSRLSAAELRDVDAKTGAWEMAAMASVALATFIAVLGVWVL
jgi:hypothetical protein